MLVRIGQTVGFSEHRTEITDFRKVRNYQLVKEYHLLGSYVQELCGCGLRLNYSDLCIRTTVGVGRTG